MYYTNLLLFFSIFGYLYEMLIRLLKSIPINNLLIGPWMPIYGFGILILEWINELLNVFKIKGWKKIILCFLLSIFLLSILEWFGGILVEKIFHTSFWNYEEIPLNIGKYINIFVSLLWGLFGLFAEYILTPIITPFLKKIPKWVSYLILFFILLDHLYLILHNLQ